jgi:hypothetical protein
MEGRVRCSTMRTMVLAGVATIAVAAYTPRVMAQGAALKGATAVSATARPTVRDSAGITIVENPRAASPRAAFTLSAQPILEIAGRNDAVEYLFSPNVAAVARLSDGRIVVGDQWSFNVRIFGTNGRYQRTFGGLGSGPGQLGPITRIFVFPGDTIGVVDGRVNLFTPDGKFIRVESMGVPGLTPLGRLTTGDWISRRGTGADSVRVFRVARAATGAAPSDTGVRLAVYDPRDTTLGRAGAYVPNGLGTTPFLPWTVIAALPDGFVMGDGQTWEIREYSTQGRLRRIIRRDADLRLSDDLKALYREGELAGKTGEARDAVERRLAAATFPKSIPAFQRILVDPVGRIWAQDYLRAAHVPLQWTVFDSRGTYLGAVEVPVGFRVFEVGNDYLLGRMRDASGQVHIRMYGLVPAR